MGANPTSVGPGPVSANTLKVAVGQNATTPSTTAALTVVNVKAAAGYVYGLSVANANASVIYIQFYNTSGTPVLGTSVVWSIAIPASSVLNIPPSAFALASFATGIGIGASNNVTGAGTAITAPSVTIFYQ